MTKKIPIMSAEEMKAVKPKKIVTPTFSEDLHFTIGTLEDKTVVGLVSPEEAFLLPVEVFELLIRFYGETMYGMTDEDDINSEEDTRTLN